MGQSRILALESLTIDDEHCQSVSLKCSIAHWFSRHADTCDGGQIDEHHGAQAMLIDVSAIALLAMCMRHNVQDWRSCELPIHLDI